jgi:hypothetical protein
MAFSFSGPSMGTSWDTTSSSGGGPSFLARMERALFGTFHLMIDSKLAKKADGLTRLSVLLLLVPRFLTTAALAVSPHSQLRPFLESFRIDQFIEPKGPGVFLAAYVIALLAVWTSVLAAAYTSYSFAVGVFRTFAPALVLRAIVGVFITALLNPTLELFLLPLKCTSLAVYFPSSSAEALARGLPDALVVGDCGPTTPASPLQIALVVLSALSLAAFIPFAVTAKNVYLDTDPASLDPSAASSGRHAVLDTVARASLVLLTHFLKADYAVLHAVLVLLIAAALAAYSAVAFPFYSARMNAVSVSMYAVVAWMAVEALALEGMRGGMPTTTASDDAVVIASASRAFCAVLVLVILLATAAPYVARHRVARSTQAVLVAIAVQEAAERARMLAKGSFVVRIADARTMATAVGGGGDVPALSSPPPPPPNNTSAAAARAAAVAAAAAAASSHLQQQQHPHHSLLGGGGGGGTNGGGGQATSSSPQHNSPASAALSAPSRLSSPVPGVEYISVRDGSAEAAEAARLFLDWPGMVNLVALSVVVANPRPGAVSREEHARRIRAGFYARDSIAKAEAVFELGLCAFPNDADVVVAYARFLGSFVRDPSRASGMLQRVTKLNPSMEHRFALFSYGRLLDQRRAKEDLGEGLDGLGILAFRQNYSAALSAYRETIAQLLALWKAVEGHRRAVAAEAAAELATTLVVAGPAGAAGSPRGGGAGAGAGGGGGGAAAPAVRLTTTAVMERIGRLVRARQSAQREFDTLLSRYPSAVNVLSSYAEFLANAWMDGAGAAAVAARAEVARSGEERADGAANVAGGGTLTARGPSAASAVVVVPRPLLHAASQGGAAGQNPGGGGGGGGVPPLSSSVTGLAAEAGEDGANSLAPASAAGQGSVLAAQSSSGGAASRGGKGVNAVGSSSSSGGGSGSGGGGPNAAGRLSTLLGFSTSSGPSSGGGATRFESSGTHSVRVLKKKMQGGIFVLLLVAITIFAVTRDVLQSFGDLLDVIFYAGHRRYGVVSATYQTRTASLSTQDGTWERPGMPEMWARARTVGLSDMAEFSWTNAWLYDTQDERGVKLFPEVRRLLDEPLYEMNIVSGPLNVSRMMGFQEAAQLFAGSATAALNLPRDSIKYPSSDRDVSRGGRRKGPTPPCIYIQPRSGASGSTRAERTA